MQALQAAITHIDRAFCEMDNTYGRPVFNEWAIVSQDTRMLYHYSGQREARFMETFAEDLLALRQEMALDARDAPTGGEFGFTKAGHGAHYDAYVWLGPGYVLVCNHTEKSMAQIVSDPNWLRAQGVFVELSQHFTAHPL
jgi:hypothetical protein